MGLRSVGHVSFWGLKWKPKVAAETSWDGSAEIGGGSDAALSLLEESSIELLLARSHCHGEDLVAVKTPEKCVMHIH
jgi:hypothetical protein